MRTEKLSNARNALLPINTGVERRMLYLAAGADLGCSLWLFWHKCDSFYLVDPEMGKGIQYDQLIKQLAAGEVGYMLGARIAVDSYEEGLWESALPGRRYHVYDVRTPSIKKRLCFVCAGSKLWLDSTTSHYNVVLNKDYAGILDTDSDYPYEEVWGRLNQNGIFGETMASGRSKEDFAFAKYRFLGLQPFMKVISDTGDQIGFGDGLVLFQKRNAHDAKTFAGNTGKLERVSEMVQQIFAVFLDSYNFSPAVIKDKKDYSDLYDLMTKKGISNWPTLSQHPDFLKWLVAQLSKRGVTIDPDLLLDIVAPLRLDIWGSWTL